MAEENREEEKAESGEGYPEEKSGGFLSRGIVKILMFVAAGLVGIILMVVISNIVFNIRSAGERKQEEVMWTPGVKPKKPPYQTMHLEPFKVNLNDPTGTKPVFVNLDIALAYEKNNVMLQTELLDRKFEIRDRIITLISSKTYEDINTKDKLEDLKKEIRNQINALLIGGSIEEIYVVDFNAVIKS